MTGNGPDFMGGFLQISCAFRQEPAVCGPDCSTWEVEVVELVGSSNEKEKIVNCKSSFIVSSKLKKLFIISDINDLNEHFKIKQVHIIESSTKIIYQLT